MANLVMGTSNANGGEAHYFPFAATLTCARLVTPTLATDASDGIRLGGRISDAARLTGGQSPTGTITFNPYGPNDGSYQSGTSRRPRRAPTSGSPATAATATTGPFRPAAAAPPSR